MADNARDRLGIPSARSSPSPSPYRSPSYLDVGYSPSSSSHDLKSLESGYGETPMSTGGAFFAHQQTPYFASGNGVGTPAISRSSSFVFPSGIAGASSGLLERRRTSGGSNAGGICGIGGSSATHAERWEAGSGWRSRTALIWGLRFGWIVLVIWCEVGEFFYSVSGCHFPDSGLPTSHLKAIRNRNPAFPTHVVLLADPQIPHPTLSYPNRNPLLQKITTWFIDLYMRKSWNVLRRLGRIDAVIVAGDMMDWGRGVFDDAEQVIHNLSHFVKGPFLTSLHHRYQTYVNRFKSIFQLPEGTPMYHVPGNHDLGLGPNRLFSPYAKQRYAEQ